MITTAISALSGAAAYNAAMAAIGGGSLAAGGFGMAGGAAVLGATVAAPILAIAGHAYNSYAESALEGAKNARQKADEAILKMTQAENHLLRVDKYSTKIYSTISKIHEVFSGYFDDLKMMERVIKLGDEGIIDSLSDRLCQVINNGYGIAAILTDIITTPLFKAKTDEWGDPVIENDIVQLATDANGMQILNDEIPSVINKANDDILAFKN